MVSHSIVIRGHGTALANLVGASSYNRQNVKGNQDIHCRHAVLTSVVVQMLAPAARQTSLHGISVRFPSQVCPPSATHHSGPNQEAATQNRLDVHFSQDTATFFYKPNLIMHDMTFLSDYDIELFDINAPTEPLTKLQMADFHCITLNFSCAVDNLLMA